MSALIQIDQMLTRATSGLSETTTRADRVEAAQIVLTDAEYGVPILCGWAADNSAAAGDLAGDMASQWPLFEDVPEAHRVGWLRLHLSLSLSPGRSGRYNWARLAHFQHRLELIARDELSDLVREVSCYRDVEAARALRRMFIRRGERTRATLSSLCAIELDEQLEAAH